MSSTVSTAVGDMVVVTHVLPANATAADNIQQLVGVRKFIACRPQALGTVQILVGIIMFLFGLAMTPRVDAIGVITGIFVWGAAFYITAGSLTVAAARRPSRCLVNCAMAFSIVAVVTAVGAIAIYALDAADISFFCSNYSDSSYSCALYKSRMHGVSGVLIVFNVLQLAISAVVIGYACNATCNCGGEIPSHYLVPGQTAAPNAEENFKGEASAMIPPRPPAYNN
ncbi:membrane-spanning 4-domains subfamily A member 8-like [Solea senegalensis]|uniref:Membrane-spanning 4-domains subfamily A member 8-like n=1 Tax=Solea senegalensis TaxID=28829 RepID=A0AAV6QJP2_SOLSE|nr:membrane-spanning 4-domains subfamily A member 4A-like [Solea senegalensis]KAG7493961.1 membrane-spanning 4-domains subfamily A member 8-like [Solea senegalensis]